MDNFVNGIRKGVPMTFGFTLETDGAPPPVGSRLQFRVAKDVTLLHASMPVDGAQMITNEHWGFSTLTITGVQTQGWNPRRTVTLRSDKDLDGSSIAELCGIVYYQPTYQEDIYCPVLARPVATLDIQARQVFKGHWQDQVSKGWIYSHDVILSAIGGSFTQWKFTVAGLPQGTKIHANPWLDVAHDGTEGVIELHTPATDQYLLEPGMELPVSIQLLYPPTLGQDPALRSLPNLTAQPATINV
ncbi:hypothetical protein [Pseudomonas sp. NPDC089569]|uniref:hypothetical protein n=1 Tax=Pseudomonas sp. NPDC089569 TaxID=3390722 RepID=UPI003CFBF3AD